MADFWQIILESNTFNFVILVLIFCIIAVKVDLPDKILLIQQSVASAINNANNKREAAKENLKSAQNALNKAETDIKGSIAQANKNAEGLYNEIIKNANEQIKKIDLNRENLIAFENKKASDMLLDSTLKQAINLAESEIISKLKSDNELGIEIVKNCIKELDNIKL